MRNTLRKTICSLTLPLGVLLAMALGAVVVQGTDKVVRLILSQRRAQGPATLPDDWRRYDVADGLPGSCVQSFVSADDSSFYLTMDWGWCIFSDGVSHTLRQPEGFNPAAVACMGESTWLTSKNARSVGLSRLEGRRAVAAVEGFRGALWIDPERGVWSSDALTSTVYCFDQAHEVRYELRNLDQIVGLTGTSPEDVWAFGPNGVAHWDGESWATLQMSGNAPAALRSFGSPAMMGPDRLAWHISSNGTTRVANARSADTYASAFEAIDSQLPSLERVSSLPLNMGRWCIPEPGTIVCANRLRHGGQWKTIEPLQGLRFDQVAGVHCTSNGVLWFFTDRGVFRRNGPAIRDSELCSE